MFKIYWDEDDVKMVSEAISAGMNWAIGPQVEQFESMISHYVGTKYCLTFNSGTSATHAALLAHGIGNDDEVIVPSFTFISTANAPLFVNAKPVFADIETDTFGLDPDSVLEKITRKTKAIMPIHYGGCPCKIRELKEIAEDHDLLLIEDAAESFGAKIGGKPVGTYGDSAMISFCQNKIITTGEGGAMLTDSKDLYEKLKLIRSHGRLDTANYFMTAEIMDYVSIGYNMRMSNITASLGISQMRKVDDIIRMRKDTAAFYSHQLKDIKDVIIPTFPQGYDAVYQLFSIRVKDRNGLMKYLTSRGIMTKIYFPPVHHTHFYRNVLGNSPSLPVTESVSNEIISLPFYPGMGHEDINVVTSAIRDFYGV